MNNEKKEKVLWFSIAIAVFTVIIVGSTAIFLALRAEDYERIAVADLISNITLQKYQEICSSSSSEFYNPEIDEFVKATSAELVSTLNKSIQIDCLFTTAHQNNSGVSSQIENTITVVVYYEFELPFFGEGEGEISWLE